MGNMAALPAVTPRPGHGDARRGWTPLDVNDVLAIQDRRYPFGSSRIAYRLDVGTVHTWKSINNRRIDPGGDWLRIEDYYGRIIIMYIVTELRVGTSLEFALNEIHNHTSQEQLDMHVGPEIAHYRLREGVAPLRATELGIFANEDDIQATAVPATLAEMMLRYQAGTHRHPASLARSNH